MKPVVTIGVGFVMLISGATLVFGSGEGIPLWVSWLIGPMLWYGGFFVSITGLVMRLMQAVHAHEAKQHAPSVVLVPKKAEPMASRRPGLAAAGVQREIPPMGGFIL
jgi:hypothetical protein